MTKAETALFKCDDFVWFRVNGPAATDAIGSTARASELREDCDLTIVEGEWREVALSDNEYQQILELLGREPTFVELGMFGAMWSEHCGYKHSRPLLKKLPTEAAWVVQGPGENAGAVDIGNGLAAVFKVESHNHPSAVEPYEGAATGVGGIVRDIFTMNARPIAILDALRFGPLDQDRNRYLFDNVVAGIGGYGNCLGIPTVGGDLAFDSSFNGNPIVNVMCVGIAKIDGIVRAEATGNGNIIVLIGAETGRDGLHGATFASVDNPEASHRGVIQVGNPFLEKQLMEACLELLDGGAVVAMQDLGAAGLTSSIIECASRGGVGIDIDVATVPRREAGMSAYEVMLSESQERMVLVAAPERFVDIQAVLERWSLSSALIGTITDDGLVRIRDGAIVHVEVPVIHFVDDCPTYELDPVEPTYVRERRGFDINKVADIAPESLGAVLLQRLASTNLGSRRTIWEQYDHTILTNTVSGPGVADAAVMRIKGTDTGVAITMDCNSRYCYLDPYLGAQHAVTEATRNVSATGARPLAITNCLNLGSPERSPGDWQLERATAGMGDACRALGIPIISGNVSLYNETNREPIHPTPMVGCLGVIEDVSRSVRIIWNDGDSIMLIGDGEVSLGGSEYLRSVLGEPYGAIAGIDFAGERAVQEVVRQLAKNSLVSGVHDVGSGGLAIALAELAIASEVGASIEFPRSESRLDAQWFGEGSSRVIIAVDAQDLEKVRSILDQFGVAWTAIGLAGGQHLVLGDSEPLDLRVLSRSSLSAFDMSSSHAHL